MTKQIEIKGHINNRDDANEILNEVISNIEKHYGKIYGLFSVSFEDQFGTPHKPQIEPGTSPNTKI